MDFEFTDDQLSLRDAVARWVDKGFAFERRHALAKAGGATRAVYAELAELGLTGLAVPPEAHGGMGFGAVEAMVVMEELGRGLVNAPYAHGALVAPALLACGPPRAGRLAAAHRRRRGAGGAGAPGARRALPPDQVTTRATATAAGTRSTAPRAWCRPATRPTPSSCRRAAGCRRRQAGIGLFLVERPRPRCAATPRRTAPAPPTDAGRTPGHADHRRRPGGAGAAVDVGIAAACAEAVGLMDKLVAITVEYMNTRKQFGVHAGQLPGAAPPHRRREDAAGTGPLDELLRQLKLGEPAAQRRRAVSQAKVQLGQSACASSASSACSCTAASA
jgi:alkylation response protein AidB-like acyl-CoA dehydrogenase